VGRLLPADYRLAGGIVKEREGIGDVIENMGKIGEK
jgi:hypothetical protein